MNPYERTSEEMKRQSEGPKRFAKSVIGAGAAIGASAFAPMLARAAPFLSQYIPTNLAIKGLSKINPKFGKFVQDAMDSGYDFEEIKHFVGDQIKQSQPEPAKEDRNIIQQYSPELHSFINQEVKNGRKPIEAGALAQNDKRFKKIISQLEKDHKTPWSSILESIYGGASMAQPQQQAQQQQPQQSGQGQQALMSILQQINQRLPGAGGQQ